jgi:ribose-phosphate pyrophosphokinase
MLTAGVNRVLTLALHSPQVHGFFSVPADHLHALRELATHFRGRDRIQRGPPGDVVVAEPEHLGHAITLRERRMTSG